ncbi:MAG: urea ABC transporter ATP-binding protein UrtD [Dehalococcoidia bacterium]
MATSPDALPVIEVQGVTVSFSGFVVLNHLDFALGEGELRFLIGPNGAGKTTLMDLISGKIKPDSGHVVMRYRPDGVIGQGEVREVRVEKQQEHQLVRHGLARKFQTPSVFRSLTCFENLEVALGYRTMLPALLLPASASQRERVYAALETVGLSARARTLAGSLSHGELQWLEIALLLVQEPSVLLLDEPVAGMTRREREQTGELLHELEGRHSILVTEHDMDFVRQFSRTVTVLHQGRLLAEGSVSDIQSNPDVVEVYLGRARAEAIVS